METFVQNIKGIKNIYNRQAIENKNIVGVFQRKNVLEIKFKRKAKMKN